MNSKTITTDEGIAKAMKKKETCGLSSSFLTTSVPAVALYFISVPLMVTVLVVSESLSALSFFSPSFLSALSDDFSAGALVSGAANTGVYASAEANAKIEVIFR